MHVWTRCGPWPKSNIQRHRNKHEVKQARRSRNINNSAKTSGSDYAPTWKDSFVDFIKTHSRTGFDPKIANMLHGDEIDVKRNLTGKKINTMRFARLRKKWVWISYESRNHARKRACLWQTELCDWAKFYGRSNHISEKNCSDSNQTAQ